MSTDPHTQARNRAKSRVNQLRRQQERAERWEKRDEIVKPLRDAGFTVEVVNERARHMRVKVPDNGWFDFWPTSGRWMQSQRQIIRGAEGVGVEGLLVAAEGARRAAR